MQYEFIESNYGSMNLRVRLFVWDGDFVLIRAGVIQGSQL